MEYNCRRVYFYESKFIGVMILFYLLKLYLFVFWGLLEELVFLGYIFWLSYFIFVLGVIIYTVVCLIKLVFVVKIIRVMYFYFYFEYEIVKFL